MRFAELREPCGTGSKTGRGTITLQLVLLPAGYMRQAGEDRSMSDFQIRGLKAVHGEHVYVY
jgi:hypothetical protein